MAKAREVRKAVIPAAGLGTRFLPATKAQPKEMLPVVDKPIIQYVVEEAVLAGIETILIVTGRGKRAIEDHFDVSVELEVHLSRQGKSRLLEAVQEISRWADIYFIRQKRPLGLGDAIRTAARFVGDEPFAVLLGDELFHGGRPCLAELIDAYRETGRTVIGYQPVARDEVRNYGIIDPESVRPGLVRARDLVEKPDPARAPSNLAIVGRYVIEPEIFAHLDTLGPGVGGEIQLTDALRALAATRGVYGREIGLRRYDVGSKLGFLQATVEFALRNEDLAEPFAAYLRELAARLPAAVEDVPGWAQLAAGESAGPRRSGKS